MEEFYNNHEGSLQIVAILVGIVAVYVSIVQPIWTYTKAQQRLNKDKRFEIYYTMIDHFAGANGTAKLDRQIAITFELRRFPEYYPVTRRILADWIESNATSIHPNVNRLTAEMVLTIEYIDSSRLKRKFIFKK